MNLKFFTCGSQRGWESDCVLLVSSPTRGILFTSNGNTFSDSSIYYRLTYAQSVHDEIPLFEAVKLFPTAAAKKQFRGMIRILYGFDLEIEFTPVSQDLKDAMIDELKLYRACNEDSARTIKNDLKLSACYALKNEKLINEFNGKFYIRKQER